ncbi:hypothetical protein SRB521_00638 [Intestinimonas butyriciproducens]|nr:hypothetical protein SRB521_00638 [Intestinimonas butyriciproducens]
MHIRLPPLSTTFGTALPAAVFSFPCAMFTKRYAPVLTL